MDIAIWQLTAWLYIHVMLANEGLSAFICVRLLTPLHSNECQNSLLPFASSHVIMRQLQKQIQHFSSKNHFSIFEYGHCRLKNNVKNEVY